MAEMTASEATEILLNLSWMVGTERRSQLSALIEQQAQEIERLNACLQYEQHRTGRQGTHAEGCYKWGPEHWECAMREVERLCDLHRSILWFVEEHKKIPNCKKWMPLIEEKAMMAIYPDEAANLKD